MVSAFTIFCQMALRFRPRVSWTLPDWPVLTLMNLPFASHIAINNIEKWLFLSTYLFPEFAGFTIRINDPSMAPTHFVNPVLLSFLSANLVMQFQIQVRLNATESYYFALLELPQKIVERICKLLRERSQASVPFHVS